MTTDLKTAVNNIKGACEGILSPLLTDDTIEDLIFGAKKRGKPKLPFYRMGMSKLSVNTVYSTGLRTAYNMELKGIATVKELDDTWTGYVNALDIASKAHHRMIADRQLGIPQIVRSVEESDVLVIDKPYGEKLTLYGAGSIFNILFIIDNK